MSPLFFVGLHQPAHAARFPLSIISVNRLAEYPSDRVRRSPVPVPAGGRWMLDSGAFTLLNRADWAKRRAGYVAWYAAVVAKLAAINGQAMACAVAPDWMCEPFVTSRTGLSARTHVGLTVDSYRALVDEYKGAQPVPLLPVLQGWEPSDYAHCVDQYGANTTPRSYQGPSIGWTFGLPGECYLPRGAWVGVGSVCKRNAAPAAVAAVLEAIHAVRPDLRLHGFGLKLTALADDAVRRHLYSADSMAWSWHARRNGRNGNDPQEAARYVERVRTLPVQGHLFAGRMAA